MSSSTVSGDPKQQLADAIRILTRAELIDHSGHCSVRRDSGTFFINTGASVRATLTGDDIVAVALDGSLVEGTARPPLEYHIHSEIYRSRPDVNAVIHTHPRWSTLLTMTGIPYEPVFGQGTLLGSPAVLDSPMSINTQVLGERLAQTLGTSPAVLLKSHGAVVVGSDLIECFALAVYLEENAQRQYMALQIGTPYVLSDEEQAAARKNLWSSTLFRKAWEHYRVKLNSR